MHFRAQVAYRVILAIFCVQLINGMISSNYITEINFLPVKRENLELMKQERKPQTQCDWLDEAMHGSRAECGES